MCYLISFVYILRYLTPRHQWVVLFLKDLQKMLSHSGMITFFASPSRTAHFFYKNSLYVEFGHKLPTI